MYQEARTKLTQRERIQLSQMNVSTPPSRAKDRAEAQSPRMTKPPSTIPEVAVAVLFQPPQLPSPSFGPASGQCYSSVRATIGETMDQHILVYRQIEVL